MQKREIVAELGADALMASEAIAASLLANDAAKYYFALLQSARLNADAPQIPAPTLRAERLASSIKDTWLDDVIAQTKKTSDAHYAIPNLAALIERLDAEIRNMFACLPPSESGQFTQRLDALPQGPTADAIAGETIDAMTSADREAGDSHHLIVMDAHKAINRLQAATSIEIIDGARVSGLSESGKTRVSAFMSGLNRTAPLKFDHPGLGTTATEHQGKLLIQNDIGTTDAHVLVIRVAERTVSVTYTDIHRRRLQFFQNLAKPFDVDWEGPHRRTSAALETGGFLMTTGTYRGKSDENVADFLSHLGSRLVFLIDWNRMRKRLRGFIPQTEAIATLEWAAREEFGHRALLEVGGEEALAEAVEYAVGGRLRYGDRLDRLISPPEAVGFIRFALRNAALGLRQGRSRRNIQDELKVYLKRLIENERLTIFDTAVDHAACLYDTAFALVEALDRAHLADRTTQFEQLAARAAVWEARADHLLNEARAEIKRTNRTSTLLQFFEWVDDAVDESEEAASLLDLYGEVDMPAEAFAKLRPLAECALGGAQELIKCIECVSEVTHADVRDDLDEFLAAFEKLAAFEHRADSEFRTVRRWLIREAMDARAAMLLRDCAQSLESATDAQVHAAQALRTYVIEEVLS